MNAKQLGLEFELKISGILGKTYYELKNETEIVKTYGTKAFGIDHLLYVDNKIYAFQDKWKNKSSTNQDVNHFINALNIIIIIENKPCYGIYLSKKRLTKTASDIFKFYNENTNNKYTSIYNENQDELFRELEMLLHNNELFLYEEDGSSVMMEEK